MKIIVLGMDNTGKTTLCAKLHEELKLPSISSCGPKKTKEEMINFLNGIFDNWPDFVMDRCCFFEEMVYGNVLRNQSNFSYRDKELLNRFSDVNIIYCRPNVKTIKNWKKREQMEGVIEEADKLLNQYDKVLKKAKKHGLYIIKYNYKKDNLEDVISNLRQI